jgi:hypothetical protein
MCVIIFEGEEVRAEWAMGIDVQQVAIGEPHDPEYFEANSGPGRVLPSGPVCKFRGKTIPCQCYATTNGSITSSILRNCLEKMDEIDLFPRIPDGPKPFLLLDGHGSRFELPFMEYINHPATTWYVCIGVPYGTSYWQVGDSTEQNGCFKMKNTEAKEKLVSWRASRALEIVIEKTDIVPIVNYGWERSFARIRTNKKAVAVRGWNPLNRALLEHPEIVDTAQPKTGVDAVQIKVEGEDDNSTLATEPSFPDVNTTDGSAGEMFAILLRKADRDEAKERRKQQQEAGQYMTQQVDKIKRLTAGVHFSSNEVRIGETALERVRAQHEKKKAEQLKKDEKKVDEQWERKKKAMEVRALNRPEDQWTKAQFKAMCMYKKVHGDKGLPDSLTLLQQCWNERKHRLSPPGSPIRADESNRDKPIGSLDEQGSPRGATPAVVLVSSPAEVSTLTENMF